VHSLVQIFPKQPEAAHLEKAERSLIKWCIQNHNKSLGSRTTLWSQQNMAALAYGAREVGSEAIKDSYKALKELPNARGTITF